MFDYVFRLRADDVQVSTGDGCVWVSEPETPLPPPSPPVFPSPPPPPPPLFPPVFTPLPPHILPPSPPRTLHPPAPPAPPRPTQDIVSSVFVSHEVSTESLRGEQLAQLLQRMQLHDPRFANLRAEILEYFTHESSRGR